MRFWCPLGIEPYLRDQRTTHFLYIWGFQAVRKTFQPRAALTARKISGRCSYSFTKHVNV